MDQPLIFVFQDENTAQSFLDAAFHLYAAKMQAEGYTVANGVIIGKDAATGQDRPNAQGTTKLADAILSPDGTYYCFALADDLIPAGYSYTTEALPDAWIQTGDSV